MIKKELLEILNDLPDDAQINYGDPNFGGYGKEFDKWSIEIKDGQALIDCPYWAPVD